MTREHRSDQTEGQPADRTTNPTPLPRRALLIGGAGLLVGAGLTEAGNALATDSGSAPRPVPSPGEDLMTEHGVLKRLLLAYQAASAQLAADRIPPTDAIGEAAQIIADFVEGFHEGLEEAYVFPRVRAQHPTLVQTLLTQHDRGRHLTVAISTTAAGDLKTPAARTALRRYLDLFVRMYAPHEAWEDTVIFPALRQLTAPRTLDELAERFADLQNTQYGDAALSQMLGRVEGVEQQLGIADLATFTPPLIYTS